MAEPNVQRTFDASPDKSDPASNWPSIDPHASSYESIMFPMEPVTDKPYPSVYLSSESSDAPISDQLKALFSTLTKKAKRWFRRSTRSRRHSNSKSRFHFDEFESTRTVDVYRLIIVILLVLIMFIYFTSQPPVQNEAVSTMAAPNLEFKVHESSLEPKLKAPGIGRNMFEDAPEDADYVDADDNEPVKPPVVEDPIELLEEEEEEEEVELEPVEPVVKLPSWKRKALALKKKKAHVADPSQLRIVYINGHSGMQQDFQYISEKLKFKYSTFNPRVIQSEFGQTGKQADLLNQRQLGDFFCQNFDIAVVTDTNPDARFLMQRIADSPDAVALQEEQDKEFAAQVAQEETGKKVVRGRPKKRKVVKEKPVDPNECGLQRLVIHTTNRFDFELYGEDADAYYDLIKRLNKRKDKKVVWVAASPFEPKHAQLQMGGTFMDYHLIRPFGVSNLPKPAPISNQEAMTPVMIDHPMSNPLADILEEAGIPFKKLPYHYGGPAVLAQYGAFINIPYRSSTAKVYENLSHGVVTFVPGPELLAEFVEDPRFQLDELREMKNTLGPNWYKYIEEYSRDLGQYHYTFDTLEELKEAVDKIVHTPNLELGAADRALLRWGVMKRKQLNKWRTILGL